MIGKPNRIAVVNTKAEDLGWLMTFIGTTLCSVGVLIMTCSKTTMTGAQFCESVERAAEALKNE